MFAWESNDFAGSASQVHQKTALSIRACLHHRMMSHTNMP